MVSPETGSCASFARDWIMRKKQLLPIMLLHILIVSTSFSIIMY